LAHLHVIADIDARHIQRDEPEVDEGSGADVRLVAVVAVERRPPVNARGRHEHDVSEAPCISSLYR
jgi:hypothetical protein